MGVLKFIFIIFLGTFSIGEIIRFDLGNNIYVKMVDIAAAFLLLAWIINNFKDLIKKVKSNSLFTSIMWVVLIMCISLVVNFKNFSGNEILASFSYTVRWVLYASLFFIVKSFTPKFKKKVSYLLLIVGGLITFFGFIQYFFYSNLRNLYYLGWDEHMHRMFSTFLDPNFAGAFFVMYLMLLLGIFLYFFENNKIKNTYFIGLVSIFSLLSIFLTYSRSALITLLTSTVMFCVLTRKLKWTIGIILIWGIFVIISSKSFYIENMNLWRTASAEARIDTALIAVKIIRENPILGIGFNTYRYVQIDYGFRNSVNANISHADAGTDNSLLFIFATTGVVGLIIYLNLILMMMKKSYDNYTKHTKKNIQKYIAIALISSMGGILINSIFINSLFYSFILIWIWLMLGLTEND